MENQDLSPVNVHHSEGSQPSLGFPLGTALLLLIIFSLSGFFSCCYHWDKLRSLRRSFSGDMNVDTNPESIHSPTKPASPYQDLKKKQVESLPVIMPGDPIPKFIALPCPCEPVQPEKISVEVQRPPPPTLSLPLPRHLLPQQPPPLHTLVYNHIARHGVYYAG